MAKSIDALRKKFMGGNDLKFDCIKILDTGNANVS